jgi:hypothetical protein
MKISADRSVTDGEVAKLICESFGENGFKLGLLTVELRKNPINL